MMRLPEAAYQLIRDRKTHPNTTTLCVVHDRKTASLLVDDLRLMWDAYCSDPRPPIEVFPPYKIRSSISSELERRVPAERNKGLYLHIFGSPKPILVTTLGALSLPCPGPEDFHRYIHQISVGDGVSIASLKTLCKQMGYEQQDLVDEVGTFAIRGFVVDIFSPTLPQPVRLEFFGDCIDSMHTFNLYTQHSESPLSTLVILAPRFFNYYQLADLIILEQELGKIPIPVKEKYRMIDAIRASEWFDEADLVGLSCMPTFIRPLEFFKDARKHILQADLCILRFSQSYEIEAESESLPISRSSHFSKFKQQAPQLIESGEFGPLQPILDPRFESFTFNRDSRDLFFSEWLPTWLEKQGEAMFCYQSHLHLQKILKQLEHQQIDPTKLKMVSTPFSLSIVDTVDKKAFIRTQDLFAGPPVLGGIDPSRVKQFFSTLKSLSKGDLVIHVKHGIGKYLGLQRIQHSGVTGEYVAVEYAHQDKLFLPIYRLHFIQKFHAGDVTDQLDSLRDQKFQKRKQKIQEKITQFAHEIIEIQAKRELIRTDSLPYREEEEAFAETFPFEETQDQTQSIHEVLRDLEKTIPMDRLLCGDVGFGKTEVAFRAIFKSLINRKQAVFLAPTTLLAHQHYHNAKTRFKDYPFKFSVLSRFKTHKEQKAILQDLKQGKIDCIIGTHRLLQSDVVFRNLGLVIIDEEQKFGVKHKEYLKRMRIESHTLSLSATPIPRTLNQALTGMRSLSIIMTPPTNRLPIHTYITRLESNVLISAVERELSRQGQLFFVVPRVADIPEVEGWMQQNLPAIPYGVAHGQLPEIELEQIMIDYYEKKYSVLISTTIIESGLDVPEANTLFIFKANLFGLAQLYQLRGRIGRSQRQAYCYLLLPPRQDVPKESKKRLEILLRYNDLGSGFQIASHDLEVRGAGNVLGPQQTGFIHDVGAELYFEMLQEAIRKLKGQEVITVDPEIHWPWESLIPEFFLPSIALRLETYQALSSLRDPGQILDYAKEIEDRYGPLPEAVDHLIRLHILRTYSQALGVRHIQVKANRLDLIFVDHPPIDMSQTLRFLDSLGLKYQFKSASQLSLGIQLGSPIQVVEFAKHLHTAASLALTR
jgi:transcription-repair coupling factor (superfamily II helicase)